MANSRSRFQLRTRRPRRKLVWVRHANGVAINVPVTGENFSPIFPLGAFETTFGANLIGCTIMAVRGVISAAIVPTDVNADQVYCAARWAMRITDHVDEDQADYVRGTLYGDQAHADWFVFEPFMLDASVPLEVGEQPETTSATEIRHVNVRSRRKIQELTETLELLVDVPGNDSTTPPENEQPIRLRWDISILIALP